MAVRRSLAGIPGRQGRDGTAAAVAVTCETVARNELTIDEALRVLHEAIEFPEQTARDLLDSGNGSSTASEEENYPLSTRRGSTSK